MTKESVFFIYLIERYAEYKGTSADVVLRKWDELEITDYICDMYEMYHCERLENAFEDIDRVMVDRDSERAYPDFDL